MSIQKHFEVRQIRRIETQAQGALQFFEGNRNVPFDIKRIYYITETPAGEKRGMHAHKKLLQFLFCPYGTIELLLDDGQEKTSILLDDPSKGVVLYPCVWRDMVWKQDNSVLCVAVSDYYKEDDYIRNYQDFLSYVKENRHEG